MGRKKIGKIVVVAIFLEVIIFGLGLSFVSGAGGNFPGTYSFDNDEDGVEPAGWHHGMGGVAGDRRTLLLEGNNVTDTDRGSLRAHVLHFCVPPFDAARVTSQEERCSRGAKPFR